MFLLYDLIMSLGAVVLFPYALIKGARYGKLWEGVGERLALYPAARLKSFQGRPLLWVHAVSVGEVRASQPLLKELRRDYPDAGLVLSCMTYTGKEMGKSLEEVDLCVFLPFDISTVVRRALKQFQPQAVLIIETEIWPNFVRLVAEQETPLLLVNGRISDRSFPRYLMVKKLLSPLLQCFARFCMQSKMDALKITRLGAPSPKVDVTGNMKFDLSTPDFRDEDVEQFCHSFALPKKRMVWVAGSTRQGEEKFIVDAFSALVAQGYELNLVLVPRYPERARSVAELVLTAGLEPVLRSGVTAASETLSTHQVLIGDTLGEMLKFYACADLVFVGGSLVPVGGHNVLEACMLSKPVLFGPYTQNNKQIVSILLEADGGVRVTEQNLAVEVEKLLNNQGRREQLGINGAGVYAEHAGATRRTCEALHTILSAP